MASRVVLKGPGAKAAVAQLKVLDGLAVKVGILGTGQLHDRAATDAGEPITVAQLAAVHEFGSPKRRIPERSFLRSAIDESAETLKRTAVNVARNVAAGKLTATQAATRLGLVAQAKVQRKIVDGPFAPNAPMTVERKGSSRPLIDTGQLRQSVSFEVVELDDAKRGQG